MRIAIWHNLPSGGGKRALFNQVKGLVDRGHELEIWCPESADPDYLPLSEFAPEHRLPFATPIARDRRELFKRGLLRLRGEDSFVHEMNRHSRQVAAEIGRGRFDVVFSAPCRFFLVPRLGIFLRGSGSPSVLYLQEPNRTRYEAMPELPWLARRESILKRPFSARAWTSKVQDTVRIDHLRKAARREFEDARSYDRILVNSFFSRESIARAYGLDAYFCPLSYDTSLFRRLPETVKGEFVLGLGAMQPHKGIDSALAAVSRLASPRPSLVWVANVADEDYRKAMVERAVELGVELEVRERISDELLVELLNRARLLLYTSHLEPFGYAPVEAGACGTPVVAVAEGGVRETIVDGVNGLLCNRDPNELAAAMNQVLQNPDLAIRLGAEGERLAQRWSADRATDALIMNLSSARDDFKMDKNASRPTEIAALTENRKRENQRGR